MTNSAAKPRKNRASEETSSGAEAERQERRAGRAGLSSAACLLCASVCAVLACVVVRQNARLAEVEEKFALLLPGRTAGCSELERRLGTLSEKCEDLQATLGTLEDQIPHAVVSDLEKDVTQLKAWSTGLTKKRQQFQERLSALAQAVESIEDRTSTITTDVTAKVSLVRTDVRRMGGLESDVESLLTKTGQLEERLAQAEKTMVRRIGDLLAGSIDRVSNLKSASERNTQSLEQMRKRIPELAAADRRLGEQLLALESGRARLLKTVTFAGDLKPKVFTIQKDYAALEPQLADLTLRIGKVAEDLMRHEQDLAQLKENVANLSSVHGDNREVHPWASAPSHLSDLTGKNTQKDEL
ncbi:inhibitor of nuclear factor kappa-B kinase-interacting protein isoform X2 [Denticeps clupeoides]|uniref:Inhibitor of nuclear factor kappa-B kinase-interacting protein n=1 Tax=Denticeps clupeoides TaxID=299321 RepID=A0AAY4EXC6_9TELE|nr:inhibitor of nuclear factor kappa-B kinase-interacting protein isoform X2 [Denticeps clupeoides]